MLVFQLCGVTVVEVEFLGHKTGTAQIIQRQGIIEGQEKEPIRSVHSLYSATTFLRDARPTNLPIHRLSSSLGLLGLSVGRRFC